MIMQYPKGEHIWTGYYDKKSQLKFIITTKESTRDFYYLYELVDCKFKKLGKSRSPKDLEEKFMVHMKIHGQKT